MTTITTRPYIFPSDPPPAEQVAYQVPEVNPSEVEIETELNIFALLRQLAALLQEMNSTNQHQKILQSLHQFELHLTSAHAIRKMGKAKQDMGWTRGEALAVAGTLKIAADLLSLGGMADIELLRNSQNMSLYSHAGEGILSSAPQGILTDNEVLNKQADACLQSTHAAIDSMSKQIDQLMQMLRELITQIIKEIHTSQYQALATMLPR